MQPPASIGGIKEHILLNQYSEKAELLTFQITLQCNFILKDIKSGEINI